MSGHWIPDSHGGLRWCEIPDPNYLTISEQVERAESVRKMLDEECTSNHGYQDPAWLIKFDQHQRAMAAITTVDKWYEGELGVAGEYRSHKIDLVEGVDHYVLWIDDAENAIILNATDINDAIAQTKAIVNIIDTQANIDYPPHTP